MAIKRPFIALLLIIAIASTFGTCKKSGLDCASADYSFKASAVAYPDNDSIRIGDTIWIKSNIPSSLADQKSNQTIDYSNASNLSLSMQLLKLTGGSVNDPGASYSANKFSYFTSIGAQINDPFIEGQRTFSFLEQNKFYNLHIAVIPKEKGIYLMAISNAVNVYRNSDKCTKANYEINFGNTKQHLFFYQNNRPGYIITNYEQTHSYCFKVY